MISGFLKCLYTSERHLSMSFSNAKTSQLLLKNERVEQEQLTEDVLGGLVGILCQVYGAPRGDLGGGGDGSSHASFQRDLLGSLSHGGDAAVVASITSVCARVRVRVAEVAHGRRILGLLLGLAVVVGDRRSEFIARLRLAAEFTSSFGRGGLRHGEMRRYEVDRLVGRCERRWSDEEQTAGVYLPRIHCVSRLYTRVRPIWTAN